MYPKQLLKEKKEKERKERLEEKEKERKERIEEKEKLVNVVLKILKKTIRIGKR